MTTLERFLVPRNDNYPLLIINGSLLIVKEIPRFLGMTINKLGVTLTHITPPTPTLLIRTITVE